MPNLDLISNFSKTVGIDPLYRQLYSYLHCYPRTPEKALSNPESFGPLCKGEKKSCTIWMQGQCSAQVAGRQASHAVILCRPLACLMRRCMIHLCQHKLHQIAFVRCVGQHLADPYYLPATIKEHAIKNLT